MTLLMAAGLLGALGLLLATALVLTNRFLAVAEDPRIRQLEQALPGNNCGACGFPGCAAFAEALAAGAAQPAQCTVSSQTAKQRIADYLGTGVGSVERRVARIACAGGDNVAPRIASYAGTATCESAALVGGGGKHCTWGCLGYGDCVRACDFDAIVMNPHRLPVVTEDLCTACGDCVAACPKDLFSLEPVTEQLWVACRNPEMGNHLTESCALACTACGKCAFDAPGVVRMQDNLPIVSVTVSSAAAETRQAIERCPTGAIVWIEDGGMVRGREAVRIVREEPLPVAASLSQQPQEPGAS